MSIAPDFLASASDFPAEDHGTRWTWPDTGWEESPLTGLREQDPHLAVSFHAPLDAIAHIKNSNFVSNVYYISQSADILRILQFSTKR